MTLSLSRRYGRVVFWTLVGTIVGVWGSNYTNSWSALINAFHFAGDGVPFALGWTALLLRWSDETRKKNDRIIIILNVSFLMAAGVLAMIEGGIRWKNPEPVSGMLLLFGVAELTGNVLQLNYAQGLEEAHINLQAWRSQKLHLAADVGASLIVIASGASIWLTGWMQIDAIATYLVGAITFYAALQCIVPHKHDHGSGGRADENHKHHKHAHHTHHRGVHPGGEGDDRLFWTQQ